MGEIIMEKRMVLRFRDLITEENGTINDHQSLINQYGEVWWGWWMKQEEIPPVEIFKELALKIETENKTTIHLFDTGLDKFYTCITTKILVAPVGNKIGTPSPETSPSYYHRGRYPAWFLLKKIKEVNFEELNFRYHSFPTKPDIEKKYNNLVNERIISLSDLKDINVTLWVVTSF
jgi:hypothetical protein